MILFPRKPIWLRLLFPVLLLSLTGCAGLKAPLRSHLDAADTGLRECAAWFAALDATVAKAKVTDIAAQRVDGFPYLRSDRFGASFRETARSNPALAAAWLERMRALDADGRRIEIGNLPAAAIAALDAGDQSAVAARTHDCAIRLLRQDLPDGALDERLAWRTRVEDDYSSLARALGLYELTRLPFHAGVIAWQERVRESFAAARRGAPRHHPPGLYSPPEAAGFSRAEVAALLARASRHPLGTLELTSRERERLFVTYAPLFEIETGGDYDRFGRLGWGRDGTPVVDVADPVVYRYLDYTRVRGRTLTQLVYVAWFPQRPRDHPFDLLAGQLDGLVWRVTLAPDAEPVLFDSIHPCGCYHQFFPTPRAEPLPAPRGAGEWAFVPATLPQIDPGERIVISLQTRSHYIYDLRPVTATRGRAYTFADYDELRRLPLPAGGTRSLFGPDGLVAGSERAERFLFWPMGVASAGAMRQAGTQATAFVGRRHFDDADLIEKRFRLQF